MLFVATDNIQIGFQAVQGAPVFTHAPVFMAYISALAVRGVTVGEWEWWCLLGKKALATEFLNSGTGTAPGIY